MLLSEAIQRTQYFIDDDGSRWTAAEITQKLKFALESVCVAYAAKGGSRLDELISVTSGSDGYADLTAYKPLQIQSVRLNLGGWFTPVPPITTRDFQQALNVAATLQIRLVRTPTFPTLTSDPITYGPGFSFETMDELICLKAARLLLTKDKELDQSLELQFRETMETLLMSENNIQVFDFPSATDYERRHTYSYHYVPYGVYLGMKAC
jgi:hypothetical protein